MVGFGGTPTRDDLVLSLATVTVSALAQPLGTAGVLAAQELVKLCEKAWQLKSTEKRPRDTVLCLCVMGGLITAGRTRKRPGEDLLTYFDRPGIGNRFTKATQCTM